MRLGSVADIFGRAEEFLWYHYQLLVKRSMQQASAAMVNPHLAQNATHGDVDNAKCRAPSRAQLGRWKTALLRSDEIRS